MLKKCKSEVINNFTKFIKNIRVMFGLNPEKMLKEFDNTINNYLNDRKVNILKFLINNGQYKEPFRNNKNFVVKYDILYTKIYERIPFYMYIEYNDGELNIVFDINCKNVKADTIIEIGQFMYAMQTMPKHDFIYVAKFTK